MPSDHVILDVSAFHAAIEAAMPVVEQGWLITFGITPTAPETGYGYIQLGDKIAPGVQKVARFVEKPDVARAQAMIESGDHVILFCPRKRMVRQVEKLFQVGATFF